MKDYTTWSGIKQDVDDQNRTSDAVYLKEREIWWIALGLNIGDEEDGKGQKFQRPVLVLKKFNNNLFWGLALSTKLKDGNPYYLTINTVSDVENDAGDDGRRAVIVSQFRLFDTKRLLKKIGFVKREEFEKAKTAIKKLL